MMATSDKNKCVKCRKVIKSTEMVSVCGLWCRKSYHNDCLGLSNSEARAVMCSKVRMKFHCEACELRLTLELLRGKETQQATNLQNCVSLLELVEKLVKLTSELSNDNWTINSKLDTVLSSNARLEQYLLESPKCFEKQNQETLDNSVGYAESNSTKGISVFREENNNTDSQDQFINSDQMCLESEFQQTADNFHCTASDFPKQVANGHQENFTESCSSDCLEEWEVPEGHESTHDPLSIDEEEWEDPDGQDSMQDALSIVKEECSPSEDFLMSGTFSIEKAENGEDEEKDVTEGDGEKYSLSEDFLQPSILSSQKMENEEHEEAVNEDDFEKYSLSEDFLQPSILSTQKMENEEHEEAVNEDDFEELQNEMDSTNSGAEAESFNSAAVEDEKIIEDNGGLVATNSLGASTAYRIQRTTEQEALCGEKISTRKLRPRSDISNKKQVQDQEPTYADRCELLYSCCMCHKTFRNRRNLNRHFRVHDGERPYRCSDLKRHARLHTDEGPYSCKVCHKKFMTMCDLGEHSQLHIEEKQYRCEICQSQFTYYNTWRNHMLLHT